MGSAHLQRRRLGVRAAPKRLSWAEQEALFDTLVTALGKRRPLATFVTGGIHAFELTRLLRVSREWLSIHRKADLVFRRPFYRQRTIATRRVLARLREHLAAPGSAAIIAVEAHWTVVRGAAKQARPRAGQRRLDVHDHKQQDASRCWAQWLPAQQRLPAQADSPSWHPGRTAMSSRATSEHRPQKQRRRQIDLRDPSNRDA